MRPENKTPAGNFYRNSSVNDLYFQDRLEEPYRSTVAMEAAASSQGFFDLPDGALVVDMACGTGSETAWLAQKYPHLNFLGIDLEMHFIEAADARYPATENLSFRQGDLFDGKNQEQDGGFHAVWLSQTLSWLPSWEPALLSLVQTSATRFAISTLAWDSPHESQVVHFLAEPDSGSTSRVNYNVYSIPAISDFMERRGFSKKLVLPFEIDIDLEKPAVSSNFGSYTVKSDDGRRMIFSSWQYLPWHFLIFVKE